MKNAQGTGLQDVSGLTEQDIQRHLSLIIASEQFAHSPRLCQLLTYLVTQSWEDNLRELREYSVGLAVFERPPDFDPHQDNIVRVSARRLRQRLQEYYDNLETTPDVIFSIPNGHYLVNFDAGCSTQVPQKTTPESSDVPFLKATYMATTLFIIGITALLFPFLVSDNNARSSLPNTSTLNTQLEQVAAGESLLARQAPGDTISALSKFNDTILENPQQSDAWIGLAKANRQLWKEHKMDFEESWASQYSALSTAIKLEPDNVRANAQMAETELWRLNFKAAQKYLDRARSGSESNSEVLAVEATVARLNNDLDRAIEQLQKAISLEPLNAELRFTQGQFYLENHQISDAISSLKNAQLLNPDREEELQAHIAMAMFLHGDVNMTLENLPATNTSVAALFIQSLLNFQNGDAVRSQEFLEQLGDKGGISSIFCRALVMANTGQLNTAFKLLEEFSQQHLTNEERYLTQMEITNLAMSPFNSPIINDQRWLKLTTHWQTKGFLIQKNAVSTI